MKNSTQRKVAKNGHRGLSFPVFFLMAMLCLSTTVFAELDTGLVGYYRFNGNTNDTSGSNNHGSSGGSLSYVEGVCGQAARLTGTGYVALPRFGRYEEGTVAGWIQWRSFGSYSRFFDFGVRDHAFHVFNKETSSDLVYDSHFGSETNVYTGFHLQQNVWYHIAMVVSNHTGAKLYLNGALISQAPQLKGSFADLADNANYYLGKSNWEADSLLDGLLDEVKIYDRALSADEVHELYNQPPCISVVLDPGAKTNPVGTADTITAVVSDQMEQPITGKTVLFAIKSGPHAGTGGTGITDDTGHAYFSYKGLLAGNDIVQAAIDVSGKTVASKAATRKWVAAFGQVDVVTTIPAVGINLDQTSISPQPFSVTQTAGITTVKWKFDSMNIGETADMTFTMSLSNLESGETRLVSREIEVNYVDASGKGLTTGLGPSYVHVLVSAFEGVVSPDKPSYYANENVSVISTVKSLSEYDRTVDARILIEDAQGVLIKEAAAIAGITLAPGGTKTLDPVIFNTGATLAGAYRAHLVLYDQGKQVGEAYGNFVITSPGDTASVSSRVVTDKAAYNADEQAGITSTVQNVAVNAILTNLTAKVTITGTAVVFTDTRTISTLAAGQRTDLKSFWNTGSNAPGTYTVTLEVFKGGTLLSTSQTPFSILGSSQNGSGITGTISATPSPVYQGLPETVTYSVTNGGNEGVPGTVTILVVDPATQQVKQTVEIPATLAPGVTYPGTRELSTLSLTPGTYLVILQVSSSSMSPKTLASVPFEVKPGVEITKTIAGRAALLVWINDNCARHTSKQCDKDPKECVRTDLVERMLTEAGIAYRIVFTNHDFAREMRNPFYTDFMILGDNEPLTDHYATELREQVYSGKGFISSLYLKHGKCSDEETIFGLNYKGQLPGSSHVVTVPESTLFDAATFVAKGDALHVDTNHPGNIMAWIERRKARQCDPGEYPGIITNQYGKGKTVFFAFDLGETLDDANYSLLFPILEKAINAVHIPADTTDFPPYTMVPVSITLKSLGGALDLRLTETYPHEIKLYDPLLSQWVTDTPWIMLAHLDAPETKTILFYALTPDIAGSYELKTDVEYLENTSATPLQSLSVTIPVTHAMVDMTRNVMDALTALPVASRSDKAAIGNAVMFLRNVQKRNAGSLPDVEKNIADILKAIESLLKVKTVDVTPVRLMLDEILKGWEGVYVMK